MKLSQYVNIKYMFGIFILAIVSTITGLLIHFRKELKLENYTETTSLCRDSPLCNGAEVGKTSYTIDGDVLTQWGTNTVAVLKGCVGENCNDSNYTKYIKIMFEKPFADKNYALTLGSSWLSGGSMTTTSCTPSLLVTVKDPTFFIVTNTIQNTECWATFDWMAIGKKQ